MNIALLGATAQSTPTLFRALALSPWRSELHFTLVGRKASSLKAIARAAHMMSPGRFKISLTGFSDAEIAAASAAADVIVIQIRFGGLEGRGFDESFPLMFGTCGDEGLGPGGLSAAWRSWPHLRALLEVVIRANPAVRILLLTSPCGLLTRLAYQRWPTVDLKALCELPMSTLAEGGVPLDAYEYFGINHLGWIYNIPGREPLPLKYWRLHSDPTAVLAEQRSCGSRATELARLSHLALQAFATGTLVEVHAALDARPAPWYTDALAPFMESLIDRRSNLHYFLSEPNRGWNPDFSPEDILEIPYRWTNGDLCRRPVRIPVPHEIRRRLEPYVEYERVAARAIEERSAEGIEAALGMHPWVQEHAHARGLATAIVDQPLH